MTALALEDLFAAIRAAPPLSPGEMAGRCAAIDRRRLDQVHECRFCGERAQAAVVAGPSDLIGRPRWLDACWPHYGALTRLAGSWEFPSDDEIVRRYETWARVAAGDGT